MSIELVGRALKHPGLDAREKLLLVTLADYANADGLCWPGRVSLSERCCCTDRHVGRMIPRLVEAGLLAVRQRGRSGNLYLVFPEADQAAAFMEESRTPTSSFPAKGGHLRQGKEDIDDTLRARTAIREPSGEPSRDRLRTGKVGVGTIVLGKKVTQAEFDRAEAVLGVFNHRAEKHLGLEVRETLRLIVGRLRENPEMTLEDFDRVVVAALADPWWDGPVTINVVFGPRVFPVAAARANGGRRGSVADRAAAGHQQAADFREAAARLKAEGL